MKIKIRTLHKEVEIETTFTDTIRQLKTEIKDKFDCEIKHQILTLKGQVLEDHKQICDYDIYQDSVLDLEIQFRLFVKMSSIQKSIDCYPSWCILDVKHEISRQFDIQANNQELFFNDLKLVNEHNLVECNLQNNSCISMTGVITVTVNFPSGKIDRYTFYQNSTVKEIKQKVFELGRIPIDRQTLNYKGRELREDQTLSSIRYTNDDNISLVYKQFEHDAIQVFVKRPGGEKRLISVMKYDAVGKIEDMAKIEFENLFSHNCYFRGKVLNDMDVLDEHEIKNQSELELKCIGDFFPVFFTSSSVSNSIFYLKPNELLSDIIPKVRSKLHGNNDHKMIYSTNRLLDNGCMLKNCGIGHGDRLFLATEDSFPIILDPPGMKFEILVSKRETIRDLKLHIQSKENIPSEVQVLRLEGNILDMDRYISQTNLNCGSIVRLDIQPNDIHNIDVEVRDLSNKSRIWPGIYSFSTVGDFKNKIKLSPQDSIIYKGIVLNDAKFICSCGITRDSCVQIVSSNPLLLTQQPQQPPQQQKFQPPPPQPPTLHHPWGYDNVPNTGLYQKHEVHAHLTNTGPPPMAPSGPFPDPTRHSMYSGQQYQNPVYTPDSTDFDGSERERRSKSMREPGQVTIHIRNHPSHLPCPIQSTINECIEDLVQKIYTNTGIPKNKIHLTCNEERLTNLALKLKECGIFDDTDMFLDDLIPLNVWIEGKYNPFWVNSSDFVATLAGEVANFMRVNKENLRLKYRDRKLEICQRFNSYKIENGADIIVDYEQ